MKKISIIGTGLLGGSLGLVLKEKKIADKVVGIGRNLTRLKKALQLNAVDQITINFKEGVKEAEMIILCLPIQQIIEYGEKILPYLKKGTILIDVGSTKKEIVNFFSKKVFKDVFFVGCHPIAGSEKKGVENAKVDLFQNAPCIITPVKATNLQVLKTVKNFWQKIGTNIILLTPQKHDYLIGAVSHLPHLIATSLVNLVSDISTTDKEIKKIIGRGFIDTTRIASSDAILWNNICFSNQKEIINLINRMRQKLEKISWLIKEKNYEKLKDEFLNAKKFREKIIK